MTSLSRSLQTILRINLDGTEWLGHSDISTTASIYSHLDYKSKLTSANVMDNVLTLPETEAVGWRT